MPGEGSIFQRKSDRRWVAQISRGPRGERTIIRRYAPLRDNTRDAAKLLLTELQGEAGPLDRRTTVGVYLRRWCEATAARHVRPATLHGYRVVIDRHLVPTIGAIALVDLTPLDIDGALRSIADGLSPKSVRNVHAVLRRALVMAERDGLVTRNVARLVAPPRVPARESAALTPAEAHRFLATVTGDRWDALYRVALLGLRQGELLGLAWSDIDLGTAELRVRFALARRDGRYVRDEPKTARSRRTVPLPVAAVAALRVHRDRQLAERIAAGVPTEDGLVFLTERGRPVSGSWLSHDFSRRLARAGLPRAPFHSLRHTAASIMAATDVPPRTAMAILGHSRIATTMEVYAHTTTADMRRAVEAIETAIG